MDAMSVGLAGLGYSVKVFALATQKHPIIESALDADYRSDVQFESQEINTSINPFGALSHLIANRSYNASRFYRKKAASKLAQVLGNERFDLIILESIYACNYTELIRSLSDATIVLRAHNVEFEIWRELGEKASGIKAWYLRKLSSQLKVFETMHAQSVDAIVTITNEDANWFKSNTEVPVHITPFSVDSTGVGSRTEADHVFHFGSMDWMPNQEGARWLINEVWPIVRSQHPDATLVLAGKNMPSEFTSQPSLGVEVIGEVESAQEFLSRNGVATAPVLSGSGMRIKAIEAMAMGLPVVGTTLGMTGLGVENGVHALVEDTPEGFAYAICKLLFSEEMVEEIAGNGKKHVEDNFNNAITFNQLNSFFQKIS